MRPKTLLIGLDGATFTCLDPLMREGGMPFLSRFFAEGTRAELRTIVPPLTPPAWTSLMTGCTPGHHGIFDFFHLESPQTRHLRFFSSQDVQSETIWSMASRQNRRVTVLNFPSMFPAPKLNGNVIPGWVPWRHLRLACWPEDLFERLKSLPGFNPRELAMDIKLEERSTEGCAVAEEYGPWIRMHTRREQNWLQIFRYLNRADTADLTAVLFDGVDKLQHLCWRFIRPEDARPLRSEWEKQIRELCLEYFRRLDGVIEQMCAEAGAGATVMIASDHGFGPTHQVFHVNQWLAEHGYLAWSEAAAGWDTQGALHGVGQVARHTWMIDWSRTKAFAATPTGNGVYIVGVPEHEYAGFRRRLMEDLQRYLDPATGGPVVEQVWTREEAFDGPYAQRGPDLTLRLNDGGIVSILPAQQILKPRPEVAGQHRPLGIFGARGPGIRSGWQAGEISILDVAPALLYSLDLPVSEEMQGRVPEQIFEAKWLAARPVRRTGRKARAAAADATIGQTAGFQAEEEQAVLQHLRELGYIE